METRTTLPEPPKGLQDSQLWDENLWRSIYSSPNCCPYHFQRPSSEARTRVLRDAIQAGMADDGIGIDEGGTGAAAYADAVATYLAFAVDRLANQI